MTTIVTGRFSSPDGAAHALSRLLDSGFLIADISSFPVDTKEFKPPLAAVNHSTEARGNPTIGADAILGTIGGASVGLAAGAVSSGILGPQGFVVGAAVGAYIGSLMGASAGQSEASNVDTLPPLTATPASDTRVAVRAPGPAQQLGAMDVLRAEGAVDIEKVQGHLRDGKWVDFDPSAGVADV